MGSKKTETTMKFHALHTVRMTLRLNRNTQGDVIEKLQEMGNKRTAYIVDCIRKDIAGDSDN